MLVADALALWRERHRMDALAIDLARAFLMEVEPQGTQDLGDYQVHCEVLAVENWPGRLVLHYRGAHRHVTQVDGGEVRLRPLDALWAVEREREREAEREDRYIRASNLGELMREVADLEGRGV